jgi:hypothetical protein
MLLLKFHSRLWHKLHRSPFKVNAAAALRPSLLRQAADAANREKETAVDWHEPNEPRLPRAKPSGSPRRNGTALRFLGFAFQSPLESLVQGRLGLFVFLLADEALFVFDFEVEEFVL